MVPRVLIVDDHAAFRSFAHRVLVADGLVVVGEAADGAAALAAVPELRPDVVLLDVGLPDMDGFAVAQALVARDGAPAVVLVSSRSRDDYGPLVDAADDFRRGLERRLRDGAQQRLASARSRPRPLDLCGQVLA